MVKPTEYTECPGLYNYRIRNKKQFKKVIKIVNEFLLKKLDNIGFDYLPFKTNKTFD